MPRWLHYIFLIITLLALIPPILFWRARWVTKREPQIHVFPDMDHQKKVKPQFESGLFRDQRGMRPVIEHSVARGELRLDDHYYRGMVGGEFATTFPDRVTVNLTLMERGRERYKIFCSPCHGLTGHGDGPVHVRGEALGGTWTQPTNLVEFTEGQDATTEESPRNRSVGHLFNTITNGIRNMPAYATQVPVADRWAILAYVRALQRSQWAPAMDVPPAVLARLRAGNPVGQIPGGQKPVGEKKKGG